ncbi:MAG: S-methyl-5'-thioinosine phosphorylase [Gammaproteobacteria bacterium]
MKLGLIGGSGLYEFGALKDVENRRVVTPWGEPSAVLTCGRLSDHEIVFLPRHGPSHRIPPHLINYRANIGALHQLGVSHVVASTAVGGIGPATGEIVIPHQLIDYTYGREHTFSDGTQSQPKHIDFSQPYDEDLRSKLALAAEACEVNVRRHGVYGATQGPRLETAAEINRLERDGCTLVGMTGMPEAALARELGLPYANLSLVVNAAAGRGERTITMEDIEQELTRGIRTIRTIIEQMLSG